MNITKLREQFYYNPDTGIFVWKIDKGPARVGQTAGSLNSKGYIVLWFDGKCHKAHRLAWAYVTGILPEHDIDHRDRNRSNNKWSNLREATRCENHQNKSGYKNNSTGFPGVYEEKKYGRFGAQIWFKGTKYFLGYFDTALAASDAYLAKKKELHYFQPVLS